MTDRPRPYHRAEAERLLDYADEWAAQAGEPMPEAGELSCLAYAAVHALLAIHDTLTAADRYAANEAKQREEAEPDPLDEDDHRDRIDADGDIWQRVHEGCWMEPGFPPVSRQNGKSQFIVSHGLAECLPLAALPGPLAFAPDADGAPSVTAPVADGPGGDAVDGEEDERRYLNAQRCLHEWAEDTRVGDTARHFICTECGTTRTEDRQ